jgi:hypothetical protein
MKHILLSVGLLLTAISTYGQATSTPPPACTLKIASAPVVRGLKLGMKIDDVLAMFPGRADKEDLAPVLAQRTGYPNFGVINTWVSLYNYPGKDQFRGISSVGFIFIDDKLVQYYVQYDSLPYAPPWRNVDDFIAKVADAFHLPTAQSWTVYKTLSSEKALQCDGFRVRASNLNQRGSLVVETSEDADQIKRERLTAFEDKARRDFKP